MARVTKRRITKEVEGKVMNFLLVKIKKVKKVESLNEILSQILIKEEKNNDKEKTGYYSFFFKKAKDAKIFKRQ